MKNPQHKVYQDRIKESETPAETDAAVLENAALFLEAAKEIPGEDDFLLALTYNMRIWTELQSVALSDEPMPDQIRANFMSLSLFVDKQTYRAISESSPQRLDCLININRQIAAGFRGIPVEQAPEK